MATIYGTERDDRRSGTAGADSIYGFGGDDTLRGLGGTDRLFGGAGDDVLDGGSGNDRIWGASGSDRLLGGGGGDLLRGNSGDDRLEGGDGNDTLEDGGGSDTIQGGGGDDLTYVGPGDDRIDGGPGTDTVSFEREAAGIPATLSTDGLGSNGRTGNDALVGVERIRGSNFADQIGGSFELTQPFRLLGLDGDDAILGGGGDDDIRGGRGNDDLAGYTGADRIGGETGDDRLSGRFGDDVLIGGAGSDRFLYLAVKAAADPGEEEFYYDGGHDTVLDYRRGEDELRVEYYYKTGVDPSDPDYPIFEIRGGGTLFDYLDSNRNDLLDDDDQDIAIRTVTVEGVSRPSTLITFQGSDSLTILGVTDLMATDFPEDA